VYLLKEDDYFVAFLDIRPISMGHTLVVPRKEVDHFYQQDDTELSRILLFAKPIVRALEKVIPCQRVGSMIAGLEVPHAHLHLVPIVSMEQFSFSHAAEATAEDLKQVHQRLLGALNQLAN